MAPSERAKQCISAAEGGCAASLTLLGVWHREGEEGLQQDDVKAAALFRTAADLGDVDAHGLLAWCYVEGKGLEQNGALAVAWMRKFSLGPGD